MEPERRIEKLLRAFAKKRREQADYPMELKPSAREELHQEISRRSTHASGGGFFTNLFSWLHPQVAFGLSALVIVAIGIWMVFPLLTERKPSTLAGVHFPEGRFPTSEQAKSPPTPSLAPPPVTYDDQSALESSRRALAKNAPASEPVPEFQFKAGSAPMVANREKQADATVAMSPAPAPAPSAPTTFAAAEKDAQKKLDTSKQSAPLAAPAGSAFYKTKGEAVASTPVVSQVFNRVGIPAARTRATGTLAVRTPLLASFRVEQNGEAIRIVDADGSVYIGAVQVARDESPALSDSPQPASDSSAQTRSHLQATQNYFFRVAGTNHNLNQSIVFSGNFIPLTNTLSFLTNAGGFGGGGGGGGARSPTPELLSNSRIAGSAVIGNQKAIEVNATPAR